jgi:adenylate kinase family enzyme
LDIFGYNRMIIVVGNNGSGKSFLSKELSVITGLPLVHLDVEFAASVTTMVSMNIGAGQSKKARKSCTVGCIISAITAAILIAIVVPLSPYLTILLTLVYS